jgi:hypothetical protein
MFPVAIGISTNSEFPSAYRQTLSRTCQYGKLGTLRKSLHSPFVKTRGNG